MKEEKRVGGPEIFRGTCTGLAVDEERKRLLAVDCYGDRIHIFNRDRELVSSFGSFGNRDGEFHRPHGIAVTMYGNYLVTDQSNHRVQILDCDGQPIYSFGGQGTSHNSFNEPKGIATDSLGRIIVADTKNERVQIFDGEGSFQLSIQHGEDFTPAAVATYNDLIAVADYSNRKIQLFDKDANFLRMFGYSNMYCPYGLCFTSDGAIVVADSSYDRLFIFSNEGRLMHTFGQYGTELGQFVRPASVTVLGEQIVVGDDSSYLHFF
jgi:DNA-binding beta-propeller fold protein YncE